MGMTPLFSQNQPLKHFLCLRYRAFGLARLNLAIALRLRELRQATKRMSML